MMSTENENYEAITIEELETDVEQNMTVEYVEVEESEDVVIEIDEAFPSFADGEITKHNDLGGRDDTDQHPIGAITSLDDILENLASTKNVYAKSGGFAELRKWVSADRKGVGYFVSLVNDAKGNTYVDICNQTTDVYGVTVMTDEVGFYGYQSEEYNIYNSLNSNILDDPTYAKVCLLGNVKVRITEPEYSDVNIGDYVVPNELGYASVYSNVDDKIKHNIGFKVISKGQREGVGTAWYYVGIALVPQNDNISRVMKKLEDAQVDLEGITIQLGDMSDKVSNMENLNIQLGEDFKGLQDLVAESNKKIDTQLPTMQGMLEEAKDVASKAEETIRTVQMEYTEAKSTSEEALKQSASAVSTVSGIRDDLEPLAQWQDKGSLKEAVTGFVAQADSDHIALSTLTERVGENSTEIIAVTQKIDDNGASIQQLITRADTYSLGPHSLSYKLTYDEAIGILRLGHIYVPTNDHSDETSYIQEGLEPVDFKVGKSYMWKIGDTPDVYTWVEHGDVYTWTSYENVQAATSILSDGDLWYCWEGIPDTNSDRLLYDSETLYRWDGSLWVSVATVNGNIQARSLGLLKQTADKLTISYTDLNTNVSALEVEVDRISSLVENTESGALSKIEQTADDILMGVYNPNEGSTSLELLLNGVQSISNYGSRTRIAHYLGEPNISNDTKRYSQPPMWDGDRFVFSRESKEDGIYYLDSTDDTKYYKIVNDGYEHYTIGSQALALLETQVDDNKSEIESLTKFETDTSETLTVLSQKADANSAEIASVAAGEYVVCSYINLEPTDDEVAQIPSTRYVSAPKWTNGQFIFSEDASADGVYYMLEGDTKHYYKLLSDGKSYEQYELASTGSASIMQIVTEQGSSIGLIVEDTEDGKKVNGAMLVEAINGQSTATISADKIDLISYAKLTDVEDTETELKALISETAEGIELEASKKYETIENVQTKVDDANASTDEKLKNYSTTEEMNAAISVKANEINLSVTQMGERFNSYSTTEEMNTAIEEAEGNAQTYTDGQLVNYAKTSEITQLADKISMVVTETEDGNVIDVASIITEINDGNSKISMNALDIDLTGYVTFNSLSEAGKTVINGSNITTGVIKSVDYSAPTDEDIFAQVGTKFDLSTGSINSKNFNIDANGNVDINGNITLDGSIVLNGSITWGDSNSCIRVLYARSRTQGAPTESYDYYEDDYESSTVWHKVYDENYDRYASYSYDCGKTWEEPIKITGEDGETVVNEVDYEIMYNMLEESYGITSTEITGESVRSALIQAPIITGGEIIGGKITGGHFHATDSLGCTDSLFGGNIGDISTNSSAYYMWGNDSLKGFMGFDDAINDSVLGYSTDEAIYLTTLCDFRIMSEGDMFIGAGNRAITGTDLIQQGTVNFISDISFSPYNSIDFNNCEILNFNGASSGSTVATFG